MPIFETLKAASNIATSIGVAVAAYQLFNTRRQAMTTFEDSLSSQYRQAIAQIPLDALFGKLLSDEVQTKHMHDFYRYFDLCNEQAFLFGLGRISGKTWKNWEDGIQGNMRRPAFAAAWNEVARCAIGDFEPLRKLCPPNGAP